MIKLPQDAHVSLTEIDKEGEISPSFDTYQVDILFSHVFYINKGMKEQINSESILKMISSLLTPSYYVEFFYNGFPRIDSFTKLEDLISHLDKLEIKDEHILDTKKVSFDVWENKYKYEDVEL